jgi:hypothetical protein
MGGIRRLPYPPRLFENHFEMPKSATYKNVQRGLGTRAGNQTLQVEHPPPKPFRSSVMKRIWLAAAALSGAFVLACFLYGSALKGEFVFDDLELPLHIPLKEMPLMLWLGGVRPVLMFSYWLNRQLFGDGPFTYHLVNLVIHTINTGLVFLLISRILSLAGWTGTRTRIFAACGSLLFLLHPLQTESVSYIAGRSESLASLFLLLAYVCYLYLRNQGISWTAAIVVILLFGLGVGAKENAVSLAGILLLTDLFWPKPFGTQGLRKNWRLYLLMAPVALAATIAIFRMLATAGTAGFSVATSRWYQYAFTEMRAIPTYVRMALIPVGQSLDHDFPISHTPWEYGAIFYGLLLLAGVGALIRFRRKVPLACFGVLMFLIFLAPTSSIVPIDDALVERRMYLPLVGLILAGCELASRIRLSRTMWGCVLAGMALFFGSFCYARNQLWGEPDKLVTLAAMEASTNPRPMLNLTEVLIRHNRCDLAVPYLQRAERILGVNYYVEVGWGRILACLNRDQEALQKLTLAARLQPCSQVFEWIGLLYGKLGRSEEAGKALRKAAELDPNSQSAHGSLALWYESVHDLAAAEREYRAAAKLDRSDLWARFGLMRTRALGNTRH